MRSAVSSIGRFRFCYFLHVFICTLFYLFRALPIHFFFLSRLLFSSWYLPFCLGMFYLALVYFLGRFIVLCFIIVRLSLCIRFSFTFSACLFCFVLVVIFVFFCFACTLVACFCLSAFVLFCYSCGISFLFYAMRFSFTSP